jgi:hypothetical protein
MVWDKAPEWSQMDGELIGRPAVRIDVPIMVQFGDEMEPMSRMAMLDIAERLRGLANQIDAKMRAPHRHGEPMRLGDSLQSCANAVRLCQRQVSTIAKEERQLLEQDRQKGGGNAGHIPHEGGTVESVTPLKPLHFVSRG